MRAQAKWLGAFTVGTLAALGATAQDRSPVKPAAHVVPAASPIVPRRDVSKWPALQQQFYQSAQRGTDWLRRANKLDGRFVYGFLPALSAPMEGDDPITQAEAALALARAGRILQDDSASAIARQALLALLQEVTSESGDAKQLRPAAPANLLDHLADAGTLVLAIHELAGAGNDLVEKADGLALYLARQQRSDGAFVCGEANPASAGVALEALARSQAQRPAAWKLDVLRKARGYYQADTKNASLALIAAFAETYRLTKDAGDARFVFARCDALCEKQYRQLDPGRRHWTGGFAPLKTGSTSMPDATSALPLEALAAGCRVARQAGDLSRYTRYRQALEGGLVFLGTLQYTPARTGHFVENFRPALVGGFHASSQDGNLRLGDTAHALAVLTSYVDLAGEE